MVAQDTTPVTYCPICGGASRLTHDHPEAEIYRCSRCTHRFSQLKPDIPMEPYDGAYFEEMHRNYFSHPDLALFERIASFIDREREPRSLIYVGCGNGNLLR